MSVMGMQKSLLKPEDMVFYKHKQRQSTKKYRPGDKKLSLPQIREANANRDIPLDEYNIERRNRKQKSTVRRHNPHDLDGASNSTLRHHAYSSLNTHQDVPYSPKNLRGWTPIPTTPENQNKHMSPKLEKLRFVRDEL